MGQIHLTRCDGCGTEIKGQAFGWMRLRIEGIHPFGEPDEYWLCSKSCVATWGAQPWNAQKAMLEKVCQS